ncbi:MAG: methionyl-tRNA formyltransferase [Clostridiales bacterium]|nr:methionyl-tRNA formyltransferase [Clostridiales bacterium]
MGTPDFSVPALEALIEHHNVIGVVTQQDKRKGRGKEMTFPPVKETALKHGISVYQPQKVREEEFIDVLRALRPDVIVVAAFGQILPESILELPEYGCINIHASLLPKYRGAAPIQWAIINGEQETGITTMYMAKGLDTGDMIDQVVVPIASKETGASLHDKLSAAGARLILETLEKLEKGTAVRTPQNDAESCYASMLTKELGEMDWNKSAVELERLIRGLNSWPSAYTHMNGKLLKIWDADVISVQEAVAAGTVTAVKKDRIYVQTGDGQLILNEVQLQGKKRMTVQAFLRGYQITPGLTLGQ